MLINHTHLRTCTHCCCHWHCAILQPMKNHLSVQWLPISVCVCAVSCCTSRPDWANGKGMQHIYLSIVLSIVLGRGTTQRLIETSECAVNVQNRTFLLWFCFFCCCLETQSQILAKKGRRIVPNWLKNLPSVWFPFFPSLKERNSILWTHFFHFQSVFSEFVAS